MGGGGGGVGEGSGGITSKQFFFAAIIGRQIFYLGMCRANVFYSNFFRKRRGGGGEGKIGSICDSP